jgi:hypothetical protein
MKYHIFIKKNQCKIDLGEWVFSPIILGFLNKPGQLI